MANQDELRAALDKLTLEQEKARGSGDYATAQALDVEIMEVAAKISGPGFIGDGTL